MDEEEYCLCYKGKIKSQLSPVDKISTNTLEFLS